MAGSELFDYELHDTHGMYRALVEHSPDAIVLHRNDQILYANPAAVQLFGVNNKEDLYCRSLMEFILVDDRQSVIEIVDKLQNKGIDVQPIELKLKRCDDLPVDVEITATAVIKEGQRIVQGMIRDVTERKATEELRRIERDLKVFRSLVSELADRTLNPLSTITGYLQLMKENPTSIPVDLLSKEAECIENFIGQLRKLSIQDFSNVIEEIENKLAN